MSRLEETERFWRYKTADPDKFEKFRVKELGKGVKITLGKIRNSDRWEIQNYMLEKNFFKTREEVRQWLDTHLKEEIRTLLDFRAWNENRRRAVNAFVNISKVE